MKLAGMKGNKRMVDELRFEQRYGDFCPATGTRERKPPKRLHVDHGAASAWTEPANAAPANAAPPDAVPPDGAPTDAAPTDAAPTDAAPTDAVTEERVSELLGPTARKLNDVKQATEGHENAIKSLQFTCNSQQAAIIRMQAQIADLQDHKRAQDEKLRAQEAQLHDHGVKNRNLLDKINRTQARVIGGFYDGAVHYPGLREIKQRFEGTYVPSAPSYSA